MKLYRVTWANNKEGNRVGWVGSKAEGAKLVAESRRSAKANGTVVESFEIEAVEFKPTKAGILALLQGTPEHDKG